MLILDFWHAAGYRTELGKVLQPQDEAARQGLVQPWCHLMKHEGGAATIAKPACMPLPPRKPAVVAKHAEVLRYFRTNVHRMDCPTYPAHGWPIGSGAVESGCKTVVGQRLKLPGDAMGRGRSGRDVPPACVVPKRGRPVGGVLAAAIQPGALAELTTRRRLSTGALPTNKTHTLRRISGCLGIAWRGAGGPGQEDSCGVGGGAVVRLGLLE